MFIIASKTKFAFLSISLGIFLLGAGTAAKADTMAYFQDNGGEFGIIDLNNGQTTIINANNGVEAINGLGVADGQLYAATSNNSSTYGVGQLWSINIRTGAATYIGKSGLDYVAFGSTSNGLFAYVSDVPLAEIVSIDPTNGAAAVIGTTGNVNFPLFSTSIDSGSLYEINAGTSSTTRYFAVIDTADGSADTLGTTLSSNDWAAMVEMNGTLYAILQAGTPNAPFATYTIDTSNGNTTLYGSWARQPLYYIAGLAPIPPLLTVSSSGSGSGIVTSVPPGIDCGTTCSAGFFAGTSVTLTATPNSGSTFTGWSGACTNESGTCVFTMSGAEPAIANYIIPGKGVIPLSSGWNLVSLPVQPANTAIASVLSGISGSYEVVWAYPNQTWQVYDPIDTAGSTLTSMQAGMGYWVKMTSTKTLSVSGAAPPLALSLISGWNLAGYDGTRCVAPSTALSPLGTALQVSWGYPGQVWQFYDPNNSSGVLPELCPGAGYWINVDQAEKWTTP